MSPPQQEPSAVDERAAAAIGITTDVDNVTEKQDATEQRLQQQQHHLSPKQAQAAIESFCEFLRFETVSSVAPHTGAYRDCAAWLEQQLQAAGCFDDIFRLPEAPEHSPVVVACWRGADPNLPCLLLNSHYDVVPAAAADWHDETPPFAAVRRDGKIYGRGTQDMKCVCVQYIYALQHLYQQQQKGDDGSNQWKPARNIYLTFVPDEEVGGSGMAAVLDSAWYKSLPGGIGLALDEGLASTTNTFSVFYGERLPWWVDVTATGPTGHGSRFIDNTAVEQLVALANKALAFRQGQRDLLGLDDHSNCAHAVAAAKKPKVLGDVTSLNITTLQAGVQVGDSFAYNCVPPTAKCSLDIRISPHTEPSEIKNMLDQWCQECSSSSSTSQQGNSENNNDTNKNNSMQWSYILDHADQHATTSTDATVNPWYAIFANSLHGMGYGVEPQVFPAATDSRFLRALGIRALGFSPMRNTEILLHENNEYIPEETFVEGIHVYMGLLKALASQGGELEDELTTTAAKVVASGDKTAAAASSS